MLRSLVCLVCVVAFVSAHAQTPPAVLYRVDLRDPFADWVFQQGFRAWGQDTDLLAHVTGSSIQTHASAFVSATDHRAVAERIALVRLQQGNPRVWIYEIRATDAFYEVNASLHQAIMQLAARDGQASTQMTSLETIEAVYGHQYEWVTHHPIPSDLIHSARAYRLEPPVPQPGTAQRLAEEPHTLLFNPNYRSLPTTANPDPWPILPQQVAAPRTNRYSLHRGLRAIGLSWCAVTLANMVPRYPRSTSYTYHQLMTEPDCAAAVAPDTPPQALVWDSALMLLVQRPVPWVTRTHESSGHQVAAPEGCQVQSGEVLKDVLMINCLENQDYAHYVVRLKASGAMYQWIDTSFRGARTGIPWWGSGSAMPVYKTKWMLSDYHYSVKDVFSSSGGRWYSEIVIAPYYPDLTYAGRQKRSSHDVSVPKAEHLKRLVPTDYMRQQFDRLPPMRR